MTTSYAGFKPRQRPLAPGRGPFELSERMQAYRVQGDAAATSPFKGLTTDGTPEPGLYAVESTGHSTGQIKRAAESLLASLTPEQRDTATFPLESDVWRRWSNIHVYVMRHGADLESMMEQQREKALGLLRETLSENGFETAHNIMKLNYTIGEITGRWEEYGDWLYWLSIMGTPSPDQPWGWQIDGHHLIVNCFVLGDQIVTTPMFMGSEPNFAEGGKYAGTRVFEAEERQGLQCIRSLTPAQQGKAILSQELPSEVFASAFRDNLELNYAGIPFSDLSDAQQQTLLGLIQIYTDRIRPGHAQVKLAEVKRHLARTHFAWMGGVEDDSVFYYRIHSPVILIEFDHQRGVALDNDQPSRHHIHTVVRTPNGNDYGKDLLRQHYEQAH